MKNALFLSFSFLLLFTVANSLYSCRADELPEPAVPTFCDSITSSYNSNVKSIIDSKCAVSGCHLNSQSPNFNSFTQVSGNAEIMMSRALDQPGNPMPPTYATALTQEEKNILSCWRNAGFPEN
jgi:hypothetical protein